MFKQNQNQRQWQNQGQNNQFIGAAIKKHHIRFDLEIIADLIKPKSKLLDIGCGNGELLAYLQAAKKIDGRGLEISELYTSEAVMRGISVIQGDAQKDLIYYPDNSFDYAILSQTLQTIDKPKYIIEEMLRIAEFAIISFPNFAHFKNLCQQMEFAIKKSIYLTNNGKLIGGFANNIFANFFAEYGILLISKNKMAMAGESQRVFDKARQFMLNVAEMKPV